MIKNNQNKVNMPTQIMDFLKKYWLIITAILVGYPYLKRYLEAEELKNKLATASVEKDTKLLANQNPLTQAQKRLKITKSKDLHAASQSLASDLGVMYSDAGNWYDFMNPRGLTENDTNVRKTLVLYRNYFNILEKLYYEVDTNSRSLRKDILQYLDADELKYLRKYLKI